MKIRSSFTVQTTPEIPGVIFVTDLDGRVSVTNDAENVIDHLARTVVGGIAGKRVIYCDSEGRWDELLHDGAAFTGFGFNYRGPLPA